MTTLQATIVITIRDVLCRPVTDLELERSLPSRPASTVRGARLALSRWGVLECVGRTKERRPRKVWRVARQRSFAR